MVKGRQRDLGRRGRVADLRAQGWARRAIARREGIAHRMVDRIWKKRAAGPRSVVRGRARLPSGGQVRIDIGADRIEQLDCEAPLFMKSNV
jgi:hypothetical protein